MGRPKSKLCNARQQQSRIGAVQRYDHVENEEDMMSQDESEDDPTSPDKKELTKREKNREAVKRCRENKKRERENNIKLLNDLTKENEEILKQWNTIKEMIKNGNYCTCCLPSSQFNHGYSIPMEQENDLNNWNPSPMPQQSYNDYQMNYNYPNNGFHHQAPGNYNDLDQTGYHYPQ